MQLNKFNQLLLMSTPKRLHNNPIIHTEPHQSQTYLYNICLEILSTWKLILPFLFFPCLSHSFLVTLHTASSTSNNFKIQQNDEETDFMRTGRMAT